MSIPGNQVMYHLKDGLERVLVIDKFRVARVMRENQSTENPTACCFCTKTLPLL